MEKEKDVNIQTQFYNAVNNSNLYEAERLIANIDIDVKNAMGYLFAAVRRTDHDMLKLLLKSGADPTTDQSGMILKEAGLNHDEKCLALLLPYFTEEKWDAVRDTTLDKVGRHHKSFQSSNVLKTIIPYASQEACNKVMVHAILKHKTQLIPLLSSAIDPVAVLNTLNNDYSDWLTSYHTSGLEALEKQVADQQKQRIEEHLPSNPISSMRKI